MRLLFVIMAFVSCVLCTTLSFASESPQTVVEGTIVQASHLPDPKTNAYPDCYYTAIVEASQIVEGKSIPRRFILVLPGFFSRVYAPEAQFKKGTKIRAAVVPFASMPDEVKQVQQADEIEEFDLEIYFPAKIESIQSFNPTSQKVEFRGKTQSTEQKPVPKKVSSKAGAIRRAQIEHDLKEINSLLAKHGGDWDKWYESVKPLRDRYNQQNKLKAQTWIGNSFFSAGTVDNSRYKSDFIKSIIEFKNYLAARNVDLILVRMPHKGEIVDDIFGKYPEDEVINPYTLLMYKELLEADVEIITDIIPTAKAQRLKYPLMYWYQDFDEIHPAEGIAWVIAEEFAKRIARYDIHPSSSSTKLKIAPERHNVFKWPAGNPSFDSHKPVEFAAVVNDESKPLKMSQGHDSKVLLIGSSIIGTPSLYQGGSIPHYFAYLSKITPDLLYRAGGDSMVLRNVAREGDGFLSNRVVCLFPFVPTTPYASFASLPIFDTDNSEKTLVASYSGKLIQTTVHFTPSSSHARFSYSPDGTLSMWPDKGKRGAEGTLRIDIPAAVSQFPYFIMEIEFASKDITYLTAKYAKQSDSIIRSDTQPKNYESFAFTTKDKTSEVTIDLKTSWINPKNGVTPPTSIKQVRFFGVKQPLRYH